MSTYTAIQPYTGDLWSLSPWTVVWNPQTASSTSLTLLGNDGTTTVLSGIGLLFDEAMNALAGTVTRVERYDGTILLSTITDTTTSLENFQAYGDVAVGTALSGDDVINGSSSSDLLFGYNGNDTFNPGDSTSPLDGLWGDFMIGGAGNDIFNGGDNPLATVVYALEGGGAGVSVDLGTGIATDTFGDTDTLNNIRVVVGTLGNDYLAGGSSDETFYPGLGTDTINGGSGFDVLSFDSVNRFFIDREFLNLHPEIDWWDYAGVLGGIVVQFDSEGAGTVFGGSGGFAVDANKLYLTYGDSSFTFTGIEKVVGTDVGYYSYDTAVFSGLYAAYTISTEGDQVIIEGPDGRHVLSGFERLQFADGIVTLPISDEPTNHQPFVASAIPDQSSPEDAAWSFTLPANTFTDIDGDTLTYSASLINGPLALPEWPLPQWLTFDPATQTFAGTPPLDFNGSLDLKVTASDGLLSTWDSFRLTVTPVNDPPTAINDSYLANQDEALIIAAPGVLLNDTDADSDPLTAVPVSGVQHGTLVLNANGSFSYTPDANYNGLDSFTYKASDGQADSNVVTVSLTVNPVNNVPIAVDDSFALNEDTTLAASVLANDSDVNGDALTASLVSGPAYGTVTLNANGSFIYTPAANYNGADSFTYKLNDGQADSNVATVNLTVNPVNDVPVAVNDSFAMNHHTVLTVGAAAGVLANDSDADGDPLYAALVSGPAHGKLTFNSDGSFVYKPLARYTGTDSFTYKAFDGTAGSDVTTVSITINSGSNFIADFTLVGDPTLDDTLGFELVSKIAITSSRDHFFDDPPILLNNQGEIYLINPDPDRTDPQRLTSNEYMDALPMLSPDGKKIVFDSNRDTFKVFFNDTDPVPLQLRKSTISDLFVMDADGENQVPLTRGSSATWSPDSKNIAFHASASYYTSGGTVTLIPTRNTPGAATGDSDLFVANVDDLAAAEDVLTKIQLATNITNTPDQIEEDADWSPDGQSIVFTSHPVTDDPQFSNQAEIYVINPDGTGRLQLTFNDYEERGPAWSPDGTRIAFSARIGGGRADFEICVMNADGTGFQQLTDNSVGDLTPSWSPDGTQIAFHRTVPGEAEMFIMTLNPDSTVLEEHQVTDTPGLNLLGQWGEVRTHVGSGDGDLGAWPGVDLIDTGHFTADARLLPGGPDHQSEQNVSQAGGTEDRVSQHVLGFLLDRGVEHRGIGSAVSQLVHELHGVTPGGPDQSATNEVETARGTFLSDGTQPANVALLGQYTAASFVGPAGAFGGTPTYESPPAATLAQTLAQPLHS
jgi:VCBS repeat-containing protein